MYVFIEFTMLIYVRKSIRGILILIILDELVCEFRTTIMARNLILKREFDTFANLSNFTIDANDNIRESNRIYSSFVLFMPFDLSWKLTKRELFSTMSLCADCTNFFNVFLPSPSYRFFRENNIGYPIDTKSMFSIRSTNLDCV